MGDKERCLKIEDGQGKMGEKGGYARFQTREYEKQSEMFETNEGEWNMGDKTLHFSNLGRSRKNGRKGDRFF